MHYSLAEVKAQKPFAILRDVKAQASANTLADMVAEVEADTRLNARRFGRRS